MVMYYWLKTCKVLSHKNNIHDNCNMVYVGGKSQRTLHQKHRRNHQNTSGGCFWKQLIRTLIKITYVFWIVPYQFEFHPLHEWWSYEFVVACPKSGVKLLWRSMLVVEIYNKSYQISSKINKLLREQLVPSSSFYILNSIRICARVHLLYDIVSQLICVSKEQVSEV